MNWDTEAEKIIEEIPLPPIMGRFARMDAERRAIHEQVMQVIEPDICALQISTEEEISGILTEEQLLTLEEYKGNRSDRRGGRGHEPLDCSAYQ